jgi:hypothetical protein
MHIVPPPPTYAERAALLDAALDRRLQAIRDDYDQGDIDEVDAANERVAVLEEHLASIRALRREYFPEENHT